MSTAIHGVLVALGTPPDSNQPRALVHCTEEQICSVEIACMMQPVVVISEKELARIRSVMAFCEGVFSVIEYGAAFQMSAVTEARVRIKNTLWPETPPPAPAAD